jgi:general secretion pathway protein G
MTRAIADLQRRVSARSGRPDAGWTLIELLVVLSLILVLASMALTQYRNSITSAKEAALRSNLFLMRDAIDQYYADKTRYPETLETLVSEHYIRAIPEDPITNATDWRIILADAEPGALTATAGVYDVKSSAPGIAIDGSQYSDW